MDNNNSLDLRLVIGMFFLIVSLILIITSFIGKSGSEINRNAGIAFLVFSAVMIWLSKRKQKGDQ